MNSPHRPIAQIERELTALRYSQRRPQDLPHLEPIERRMGTLAAQHAIDPGDVDIKADLWQAGQDLAAAKTIWDAHAKSNTDIRNLEIELNDAQQASRMEAIAVADDLLNEAISEYKHNCLLAARSLRKVLQAQHRSANTPGAGSNLSGLYLHKFHIGHLLPISWQGTLGEVMRDGTAPFEQPPLQPQYPDLKRVA